MSKNEKKGCSNCRYQQTGWDGGFHGEPMTCECRIFGETENRKDCKKFKRPFPKGFELLTEFGVWLNGNTGCNVDADDVIQFWREWK